MTRPPVLAGLVLVGLGTVLLLGELGAIDATGLLATWWPLAVIAAGVVQLTVPPRSLVGGPLVIAIGAVLLLWRLEVVDDLALLWPVLLLTLGGWLLLGQRVRRDGAFTVDGVSGELDLVTVFSDRRVRVAPGGGASGSIVTVFGDVDLDLTAATPGRRARLDGVTVFGDVQVQVPADWRVTVGGATLFGGVQVDEGTAPRADETELRLDLVTVFGDVRVARTPVPVAPAA
jgi:hypothetical protein